MPLEAAKYAKKIEANVIVILSLTYCKSFKKNKDKIYKIADIYIDNYGPIGDSLVKNSSKINVASPSVISGSYIFNSILVELSKLLIDEKPFPFYLSSNLKGASLHNKKIEMQFSKRNKFLK